MSNCVCLCIVSSLSLLLLRSNWQNVHIFLNSCYGCHTNTTAPVVCSARFCCLTPPTKLLGVGEGYIGFTPPVRPSVRPSIRSSRIPCPLCSAYSSGWIHFISIHLIKQLQRVCHVYSLLQKLEHLCFWHFCLKLVISSFDLRFDVNHLYGYSERRRSSCLSSSLPYLSAQALRKYSILAIIVCTTISIAVPVYVGYNMRS